MHNHWRQSSWLLTHHLERIIEVCIKSFLISTHKEDIHNFTYPGYSAVSLEKISQHIYDPSELAEHRAKAPDMKESFECGREEAENLPNIWLPEGVLPGFKEACLDFFWVCWHAYSLFRCLAKYHVFWRVDLLQTRASDSQGPGPWIQPPRRLLPRVSHSG